MNIADLFRRQAAARPSAEAFRCRGERFTWADVDRRSDALAVDPRRLARRRRPAGHRRPQLPPLLGGPCRLRQGRRGGRPDQPPPHRTRRSRRSSTMSELERWCSIGACRSTGPERAPSPPSVPGDAFLAFGDDGAQTSYEDAATRPVTECVDRRHPVNVIGFTSGTTGRARGAILSQRTATMSALWFANLFQLSPSSTFLACMPAYVYRGQAGGMAPVVAGATIVPLLFEAGAVLDAIEEHRVTHAIFAPAMVDRLLAHPDLDDRDLSSLEGVWIGGAPSSPGGGAPVRHSCPSPPRLGVRHDRSHRHRVDAVDARRRRRRRSGPVVGRPARTAARRPPGGRQRRRRARPARSAS